MSDARYLYLSLFPEALVASQLPPEAFGTYYAVGDRKRSRGQALYFEVDPARCGAAIDLRLMDERCVPEPDGTLKRSVYLAIYRVLERVPVEALGRLYLATDDGRVLALSEAPLPAPDPSAPPALHLYQELCPGTLRAASRLDPRAFVRRLTDPREAVAVPRLAFAELTLGQLALDPRGGSDADLPYAALEHLRDCLEIVRDPAKKPVQTVMRALHAPLHFRTIASGFYLGAADALAFYPFPDRQALETTHYAWWRSARTLGFAYS